MITYLRFSYETISNVVSRKCSINRRYICSFACLLHVFLVTIFLSPLRKCFNSQFVFVFIFSVKLPSSKSEEMVLKWILSRNILSTEVNHSTKRKEGNNQWVLDEKRDSQMIDLTANFPIEIRNQHHVNLRYQICLVVV